MYAVKVVTPPSEKGFVNGFTEWFQGDGERGAILLTREPLQAERMNRGDAQLTAAWLMDEFPERTVTVELVD